MGVLKKGGIEVIEIVIKPDQKGEVPEWTKGTDCKSVAVGFGGSNPPLPTLSG